MGTVDFYTTEGGEVVARPGYAELNMTAGSEMTAQIKTHLDGTSPIVWVDLANVLRINSAGADSLVAVHNAGCAQDIQVKFVPRHEAVKFALRLLALNQRLTIVETLPDEPEPKLR